MKKLKVTMVIIALMLLPSCSAANDDVQLWMECISWMQSSRSCTVRLETTDADGATTGSYFGEFGSSLAHICDKKLNDLIDADFSEITDEPVSELWFKGGDAAAAYVYSEEYDYWIGFELPYDDNYFYPYSVFERMRKYNAWVDSGELVYDEKEERFSGAELSGAYLFDGEEHHIIELSISAKNGKVTGLKEIYYTDDPGIIFTDELSFENIGSTRLSLPKRSVDIDSVDMDSGGLL